MPQQAKTYGADVIVRSAMTCLLADVPCAIWGPPGCAKSDLTKLITKHLNAFMVDLRLGSHESTDFTGIPSRDEATGTSKFWRPQWMPFVGNEGFMEGLGWNRNGNGDTIKEGEEGYRDQLIILFMDECDRCPRENHNIMLQLTLDRMVAGHKLMPNVRVILAGNGGTDIGTTKLGSANASRMCHLHLNPADPGTLQSWVKWAGRSGMESATVNYQMARWDNAQPYTCEEIAVCNNRTITFADALWKESSQLPWHDTVKEPLVFGCIGEQEGKEFIDHQVQQLPSIVDIMNDPSGTRVPGKSDHVQAITNMMVSATKSKAVPDDKKDAVNEYVKRFPSEEQQAMRTAISNAISS